MKRKTARRALGEGGHGVFRVYRLLGAQMGRLGAMVCFLTLRRREGGRRGFPGGRPG